MPEKRHQCAYLAILDAILAEGTNNKKGLTPTRLREIRALRDATQREYQKKA